MRRQWLELPGATGTGALWQVTGLPVAQVAGRRPSASTESAVPRNDFGEDGYTGGPFHLNCEIVITGISSAHSLGHRRRPLFKKIEKTSICCGA
jgi:hypothetical protein